MCELLGLAFNKPISPGLSFRDFRQRAKRNRDGWGLAAITPTKARITKEAARTDQSDVSESLRDDPLLKAPIFIGLALIERWRNTFNTVSPHNF
jgi:predicted glutamine amidotransferase